MHATQLNSMLTLQTVQGSAILALGTENEPHRSQLVLNRKMWGNTLDIQASCQKVKRITIQLKTYFVLVMD